MCDQVFLHCVTTYYQKHMPCDELVTLLTLPTHPCDPSSVTEKREFGVEVPIDEDRKAVWMRPLSFATGRDLRRFLAFRRAQRIDVGAMLAEHARVYKGTGKKREWVALEIRFDIDANDQEYYRGCCRALPKMCAQCAPLLRLGAQCLTRFVQIALKMKHLLWVFSGKKGVHGWVCDNDAIFANETKRAHITRMAVAPRAHTDILFDRDAFCARRGATADFLRVEDKHMNHPVYREMYKNILAPFLDDAVSSGEATFLFLEDGAVNPVTLQSGGGAGGGGVDIFVPRGIVRLAMCACVPGMADPDDSVNDLITTFVPYLLYRLSPKSKKPITSAQAVELIEQKVVKCVGEKMWRRVHWRMAWSLLPRLDEEITSNVSHMLKAPWSVHPSTHRVCLPFNPADEEWNPFDDNYVSTVESPRTGAFDESLRLFKDFVNRVQRHRMEEREKAVAWHDESMDTLKPFIRTYVDSR